MVRYSSSSTSCTSSGSADDLDIGPPQDLRRSSGVNARNYRRTARKSSYTFCASRKAGRGSAALALPASIQATRVRSDPRRADAFRADAEDAQGERERSGEESADARGDAGDAAA